MQDCRPRFRTTCLASGPTFVEHRVAHAVSDPNGRAYNRTAFLPDRPVMIQAWAVYLTGWALRAGKSVEG